MFQDSIIDHIKSESLRICGVDFTAPEIEQAWQERYRLVQNQVGKDDE
jgi:hypothetical protein